MSTGFGVRPSAPTPFEMRRKDNPTRLPTDFIPSAIVRSLRVPGVLTGGDGDSDTFYSQACWKAGSGLGSRGHRLEGVAAAKDHAFVLLHGLQGHVLWKLGQSRWTSEAFPSLVFDNYALAANESHLPILGLNRDGQTTLFRRPLDGGTFEEVVLEAEAGGRTTVSRFYIAAPPYAAPAMFWIHATDPGGAGGLPLRQTFVARESEGRMRVDPVDSKDRKPIAWGVSNNQTAVVTEDVERKTKLWIRTDEWHEQPMTTLDDGHYPAILSGSDSLEIVYHLDALRTQVVRLPDGEHNRMG